jgi:Zn-dependent protease with chaperone function
MLVGGASLFKVSELSAGGHVVAESLGGRPLDPNTATGQQRKVLNVVEEMAIASGTPVPPVYLIDESGINAFAAGYTPDDAVIGVTRGAVETLSRDELQGVIAHEFSHILNGDMRLNIRLMGIIFGIVVIGAMGAAVMRAGAYSSYGRRSRKDNSALVLILLGLALTVIGFIGAFFGRAIKAAVSRQREYLADASAVQFTRNPDGIAGALKKIGGWADASTLKHPNAGEVSHMLFGSGVIMEFGSLMSTHPPLEDRIRRIDPSFDGKFLKTHRLSAAEERATGFAGAPAAEPRTTPPTDAIEQIGRPTPQHVAYAAKLIRSLPSRITDSAREPFGARAVVYAMLIDADPAVRQTQLDRLSQYADPPVFEQTVAILPLVAQLNTAARLPLIDLTIPALRALSPGQYGAFAANIDQLVRADERVDLFEWALQRILQRHLEAHFHPRKPPAVRYRTLDPLAAACSSLLSTLAYVGHQQHDDAVKAFDLASRRLRLENVVILGRDQCGLRAVGDALDQLASVATLEKRRLLEACAGCVSADGQVSVHEAELFRAVCDALGCPMPPLLPGQPLIRVAQS